MSDRQTELNEAWADKYLAPHVDHLTRNGSDWLMCSPLREDHNPSFSVNVEKGAYNDFATGDKGTLSELAERMNVPAPIYEKTGQPAGRSENPAAKEEREAQARIDTAKIEAARAIWEAASPDLGEHRYILEKQINTQGLELRRLTGTNVKPIKYPKENGDFSEIKPAGQLVIPMRDVKTDELIGVELIDNYKGGNPGRPDKYAKRQYRAKAGNYPAAWQAGTCADKSAPVVLCEGMATAASVKQIVGDNARVLCCFSSEHVPSVGRAIATRKPSLRLIVATDADEAGEQAFLDLVNGEKEKTATGRDGKEWKYKPVAALEVRPPAKAKRPAKRPNIQTIDDEITALFDAIRDEGKDDCGKTDWNDMLLDRGLDGAKRIFNLRLSMARERSRLASMTKAAISCEARTLADLSHDDGLKEYEWIIPDLLPAAGLSILAGISGCGKSFLALRLAIEAARGGMFLGRKVEKADVLYCALEDPVSMTIKRARDVLGLANDELEELTNLQIEAMGTGGADGFSAAETGALRLDRQGVDYFTSWIFEHITARRRLIVVDVMQEILPDSKNARGNAYQIAYETLSPLKLLATRTNTDILFIHHASFKNGAQKGGDPFDVMIGSIAYKAAMQARFLLNGSATDGKARLIRSVKGASDRDMIYLTWCEACTLKGHEQGGGWQLSTDEERRKEENAEIENSLSPRDAQIMDALNEHPGAAFTLKEVSQLAGVPYNYIRHRVAKLIEKGLIMHDGTKIMACLPEYLTFDDIKKDTDKRGVLSEKEMTHISHHDTGDTLDTHDTKILNEKSAGLTKDFSVSCDTVKNGDDTEINPDEHEVRDECVMCVIKKECDIVFRDIPRFAADSLLRQYDENGEAPPILQAVGESLASLAARAGVSVEELRECLDDEENADLSGRFDLRDGVLIVAPMDKQNDGSTMDETNGASRNGPDSSFAGEVAQGAEVSL